MNTNKIPALGSALGQYVFTDDERRLPKVDPDALRKLSMLGDPSLYVACAVGEGMKRAGILDGDLLLMNPQGPYGGGDLVGAMVNGVAMLRRLTIVRSIPHLMSDNDHLPELLLAVDIQLIGTVHTVVRRAGSRFAYRSIALSYSRASNPETRCSHNAGNFIISPRSAETCIIRCRRPRRS